MGLFVKKSEGSGNFEPIEEGLHHAVAYMLVDLGTTFNDRFGKSIHKVLIGWEIPDERIELERDGKMVNLPRAISKRYTLSLHEKSILRKELESWRGRAFTEKELSGFDMKNLLGANCMIQVIHTEKNERTYANVSTVVSLPKGTEKKRPENALQYFSFEEGTDIPSNIPDWATEIIRSSDEYRAMQSSPKTEEDQGWGEGMGDTDESAVPF